MKYSSVQFSCSVMSNSLWPHGLQQARFPCPSPIPGVYSNSCPLSQWCHPTISSSVVPFSSCSQLLPAKGSFPMSQLFTSGGQSIGVSASDEYSGLISFRMDWLDLLAVQGPSRVFSNTTVLPCSAFFIVRLSHPYTTSGRIKTAGRNINNFRYTDDTTLMAESGEKLKSFLMKVKEESEKAGLNSTFKNQRSWHLVPSLHCK